MADNKRLIKTDKNGTKYYEADVPCWRCMGKGIYYIGVHNNKLIPSHVDDGICFACHGSGKLKEIVKEYTPEHEAKLKRDREQREARLRAEKQAKADEINAIWLKEHGFDADGNVWIVLGNTYIIRDQLRELGCQFNSIIGWHIDHELTEYPTIKLTSSQLCLKDIDGVFYALSLGNATELIGEANDKIKAQEPESSFVGSVGERIEVDATFWNEFTFTHENFYGMQETSYIYIFKDSNGNQMKWSTSAVVPFGIGTRLHLKGTVKEHSEYKGIKQTILTRCKVMAKEVR